MTAEAELPGFLGLGEECRPARLGGVILVQRNAYSFAVVTLLTASAFLPSN